MVSFGSANVSAGVGEMCWKEGCGGCFMALYRRIWILFVTLPRDGIWGAEGLVMSYFIVSMPFR